MGRMADPPCFGAFIREDFGETLGLMVDLRPAVGGEGKLADLIGTALGLELFFSLADAGQFRSGIDHVGDQVVIDLASLAMDLLDTRHRFIFSLVREHRPGGHVADHPDPGGFGAVLFVGEHAALVSAQADVLQSEALGIRTTTDSDQHVIGFKQLGRTASGRLDAELHAVGGRGGAGDLRTQLERDALFAQ